MFFSTYNFFFSNLLGFRGAYYTGNRPLERGKMSCKALHPMRNWIHTIEESSNKNGESFHPRRFKFESYLID
tara:strand:+ start:743 stop:958 length:216 start_codon:yes stop_codon:yes gene_type:complete